MRLDPNIIRQQVTNLLVQFPELAEDQQLRTDMIEGETDAFAFLAGLVCRIEDTKALSEGTDLRIKDLQARTARFDRRLDGLRSLVFKIMEGANLKKCELSCATLSIRNGQRKLIGDADPKSLSDDLCKIKREIDRTKIKEKIESGGDVPGFQLSNGESSLSIRIK